MKAPFLIASVGMIAFACASVSTTASADEVTTTTKTTKTTEPAGGVVIAAPPVAAGVVQDGGCATKRVTKTDEEGDATTKTKTNCD